MAKKPELDDVTRQIAERMLSMPPKPHGKMKIGKPKGNRVKTTVNRDGTAKKREKGR